MYSCVLVVGSGMKFQGIGMWLHNRISLQIPYMYRAGKNDELLLLLIVQLIHYVIFFSHPF